MIILALLAALANGSEVDSFTHRNAALLDETVAVDRYVNGQIMDAVLAVDTCNEEDLLESSKNALAQSYLGGFERHLLVHSEISHVRTSFDESVYQEFPFLDAPMLHITPFGVGALMVVNGQHIGADKIGHFFTEGRKYFDLAFRERRGVETALAYGWGLEQWLFGRNTTGVQSFGDLAANYNGMLFWQNLLGEHPRSGLPPLVVCQSGRYRLNRFFSIAEYVDESFDEAYNCSEYATPEMQAAVERRLQALSAMRGQRYACPMDPTVCVAMRARYGEYASRIVSPRCQ